MFQSQVNGNLLPMIKLKELGFEYEETPFSYGDQVFSIKLSNSPDKSFAKTILALIKSIEENYFNKLDSDFCIYGHLSKVVEDNVKDRMDCKEYIDFIRQHTGFSHKTSSKLWSAAKGPIEKDDVVKYIKEKAREENLI